MSGKCHGKILSGKSGLKLFIVSCVFACIFDFAELVHFILVSDHALLHCYPNTDNNTSTGMIRVTLTWAGDQECLEPSGKCQGISHCLGSGHPVNIQMLLRGCQILLFAL